MVLRHSFSWDMVLDHSFGHPWCSIHCIRRSKQLYKLDPPHLCFHSWTIGD